ncbi:MAG: ABC transporter permease [Magnetovibrionaceae bacterium]
MSFVVVQFLTGLASAVSLFLVASGLSLIFGVTRIVNFAHGSLYMLGAYFAVTLAPIVGFWWALVGASLGVGIVGVLLEVLLLRRLYGAPELVQLVATFAVVLILADVTLAIWGPDDILGPRAPGLDGAISISGSSIPTYDLFLIILGPLVLGGLWFLLHRTRFGILVRAASQDREMLAALGVDQKRLFTLVFFIGAALAGLGGAVQMPREPANLLMDLSIIAEVFVVVVIGGMGSLPGAFLAAVLIGELHAFGIVILPEITLVLVFLVMAVVLVVRPWGLLGRPESVLHGPRSEPHLRPLGRRARIGGAFVLLALVAAPFWLDAFGLNVATEIVIFAVFAASLHLIMGLGGMVSFGHAAYLGLGAYGSALVVSHLGAPMGAALIVAPLVAGAGAALFGWFAVRLSGVYLAMLTLAFAQITWAAAFQWYGFTGGDNGILGVWPPKALGSPSAFYWLTLGLGVLVLFLLYKVVFSPFGFGLRAVRDARARAEACGLGAQTQQWIAFIIAGGAAGLAGGLYAFLKGSVFPDVLAIPVSVDGLVMVLLGGLQTLAGPLLGAVTFTGLKIGIASETDLWRAILGSIIIACVLLLPGGLGQLFRKLGWQRS